MKKLMVLAVCLCTFLTLPAFVIAAFPDRNITLVVPFSPGGGFDSISRAIARSMKKYTPKGVDVIVKNVIGAGGLNGTVFLYRSKPNGYMIGHLYSGQLPTQMFRGAKSVGYDMQKFTWLAQVGRDPYGLIVRKESRYQSLGDLQAAKRIKWGVESIGAGRWPDSFIAAHELKIPFDVVAGYVGTGGALPALLRGDYDVLLQTIDHPSVTPYVKTGEIVPILNRGATSPKVAPKVPTAKDSGYNLELFVGRFMAGPPGVALDRAKVLEGLLSKAMDDPQFKAFTVKSGIDLESGNAEAAKASLANLDALFTKYTPAMLKVIGQ